MKSAPVKCYWIEKMPDGKWIRPDTGEVREHATLFPPGAIYAADWDPNASEHKALYKRYADGMLIVVITPGGAWVVDGPGYNQRRGHYACPWTRTGDPKRPETFTVKPSINQNEESAPDHFHGWLTSGVLSSV